MGTFSSTGCWCIPVAFLCRATRCCLTILRFLARLSFVWKGSEAFFHWHFSTVLVLICIEFHSLRWCWTLWWSHHFQRTDCSQTSRKFNWSIRSRERLVYHLRIWFDNPTWYPRAKRAKLEWSMQSVRPTSSTSMRLRCWRIFSSFWSRWLDSWGWLRKTLIQKDGIRLIKSDPK